MPRLTGNSFAICNQLTFSTHTLRETPRLLLLKPLGPVNTNRQGGVARALVFGRGVEEGAYPQVCDRRATKPESQRTATLRARFAGARGGVAHSSRSCGYAPRSRLAPRPGDSSRHPCLLVLTGPNLNNPRLEFSHENASSRTRLQSPGPSRICEYHGQSPGRRE